MNGANKLKRNIEDSIDAKMRLASDSNIFLQFSRLVELVLEQYKKGGRLYIA
jgi:D-sedoheptulose 7-phosphate isomerase